MNACLTRPIHALLGLAGLRCRRLPDLSHDVRPWSLREVHLSAARLLPTREHILPLIPTGSRVAEVGVGFGDFSRKILDVVKPREFVAVDLFELHEASKGGRRRRRLGAASHEAYYRQQFKQEIDDRIVQIRKGPSHIMLEQLPDDRFDLVYIDANHAYARVKRDVEAGRRKLRPGGLLALDDYERGDPFGLSIYGVKHAAHELCVNEGWKIVFLALEGAEAACNIVLQRPPV